MIQELFSLRICPSCGKYQVFCLHNKDRYMSSKMNKGSYFNTETMHVRNQSRKVEKVKQGFSGFPKY